MVLCVTRWYLTTHKFNDPKLIQEINSRIGQKTNILSDTLINPMRLASFHRNSRKKNSQNIVVCKTRLTGIFISAE